MLERMNRESPAMLTTTSVMHGQRQVTRQVA